MAAPSNNVKISLAKHRVAVFGGDSRVHALEGTWTNDETPDEIDVTTFVSTEGSTARLVAALRAGGYTHVVMLTRWMGHSNYKNIKQAAEIHSVKVLHWKHGLGKLEDELVNIVLGKTEADPDEPEPEAAEETAPPVQLVARNAGLTVACYETRHDECVYKDKAIVRCGCDCHPKAELPVEPTPPPPFQCTREQVFEVMRLDERVSWRVSEIAEMLMAKEPAHFKVVRTMVKELVFQGALIKMDHEHVALPKPTPNTGLSKLRAYAATLSAKTDALNMMIGDVEMALKSLQLGVHASVGIENTGGEKLHFMKNNDAWGLFYGRDGQISPVKNASREARINAVAALPALLDALITEAEKNIADVDVALKLAETFVAQVKSA